MNNNKAGTWKYFIKKVFSKILKNSLKNNYASLFFDTVAGLRAVTLLKKF